MVPSFFYKIALSQYREHALYFLSLHVSLAVWGYYGLLKN